MSRFRSTSIPLAGLAVLSLLACGQGTEPQATPDPEPESPAGEAPEWTFPMPQERPRLWDAADAETMNTSIVIAPTDDLENQLVGSTAGADDLFAGAGALPVGGLMILWSFDTLTAVDLVAGEQRWTSDLDMDLGGVCQAVAVPEESPTHLYVSYTSSLYERCTGFASVDLSDGAAEVLQEPADASSADSWEDLSEEETSLPYEPAMGGSLMVQDEAVLYLGREGRIHRMEEDGSVPVGEQLRGASEVLGLFESDVTWGYAEGYGMVVAGSFFDGCEVIGTDPEGDASWHLDTEDIFGEHMPEDLTMCDVRMHPHGHHVLAEPTGPEGTSQLIITLDPATGEVLSRAVTTKHLPVQSLEETRVDIYSFHRATWIEGDLVVSDFDEVVRLNPETGERVWTSSVGREVVLHEGHADGPSRLVLPVGTDSTGRYVFTQVGDERSVEDFILLDGEDGSPVARWRAPEEYAAGLMPVIEARPWDGGMIMLPGYAVPLPGEDDYETVEIETADIVVLTWP
ncbi:outer membrane protein assembly factor BamB family protein [Nesterenkonia flava]|uniref:PQQ-binding-like beta-propeller repeat protein n=1 Tax=Nesterenkonia flava TaxID=469799 RepID=A0ABU1FQU7_9MICC|nr:PQQ-binding-like beta-propeller repeat protein [Nesterenkonia flava]MDR5711028.1 PQQ-binding-like beta-propeller repeat protein [Nesterenkonia flava]